MTLSEGRATLELHYCSDEQALRKFCAEYPIYSESQLDGIESYLWILFMVQIGSFIVAYLPSVMN